MLGVPARRAAALVDTAAWNTTASTRAARASGPDGVREASARPLHARALVPLDRRRCAADAWVWHEGASGPLFCSQFCAMLRGGGGRGPDGEPAGDGPAGDGPAGDSFVRRQFAYLVMVRSGRPAWCDEWLASTNGDALVLAWGDDAVGPQGARADVFLPNSSWPQGRNALYALARARGRAGLELSTSPSSTRTAVRCVVDWPRPTAARRRRRRDAADAADAASATDASPRRCWRLWERLLLSHEPELAVPALVDAPSRAARRPRRARLVRVLARRAGERLLGARARALLPYLEFGGASWAQGAVVLAKRAAVCYLGDVLQFNAPEVGNAEHAAIPAAAATAARSTRARARACSGATRARSCVRRSGPRGRGPLAAHERTARLANCSTRGARRRAARPPRATATGTTAAPVSTRASGRKRARATAPSASCSAARRARTAPSARSREVSPTEPTSACRSTHRGLPPPAGGGDAIPGAALRSSSRVSR